MRIHSVSKINTIKQYRRAGYSIQELVAKFGIPKTTIWHHIHRVKLSKKSRERIKKRRGGSKIRIEKQWLRAEKLAEQIIKSININKTASIILSLLYWAEGNKRGFVFTNTDPNMIRIFLKILRETFGVANADIVAIIRINVSNNSAECVRYWRKITNIARKNISVDFNARNNKSKARYGILRIVVKKGGRLFKLVNMLNVQLTLKLLSSILDIKLPLVAQMD